MDLDPHPQGQTRFFLGSLTRAEFKARGSRPMARGAKAHGSGSGQARPPTAQASQLPAQTDNHSWKKRFSPDYLTSVQYIRRLPLRGPPGRFQCTMYPMYSLLNLKTPNLAESVSRISELLLLKPGDDKNNHRPGWLQDLG